jgi:uncharacterized XkdX family phage protein
MDWQLFAQNDWDVYHDPTRIAMYVQKGKITADQYQTITGQPYTA